MSNTGELGKTANRFKLSNPPASFNKTGTLYRIKKNHGDQSRKEKKKRGDDSSNGDRGLEETLSVTAKPIGRQQPVVQKNIDIHIGNVNTYNIYFTGDQKQGSLQPQTPTMSRGNTSPDFTAVVGAEVKRVRRQQRPIKNQPKPTQQNIGPKSQSLTTATVAVDSRGAFKIGKVKRNNLIPKDDASEEASLPTVIQKPVSSKYKSYGYESRKPKRASEDDSSILRQPSPLENRLRMTADRFRKY